MKKLIAIIVWFCLFFPSPVQAQNWLGTISSDWNTPGNWQGGILPTSSTSAIFNSTSVNNCTITGSINVGGLDILSGYTGTISISTGSSLSIGSNDFIQADGTFDCGSGAFICDNNADFECTGGTLIASSNTTTLGNNITFQRSFQHNNGSLQLNSTSGTTTIQVNNSVIDTVVLHDVTINAGNVTDAYRIPATNTLIIEGSLQIAQGCLNSSVSGTDTSKIMLQGNLTINQTGTANNRSSSVDIDFIGNNNTSMALASGGESLFNGRMTFNKTSAANTITLNSPLILNVTNSRIYFKKGKLITSAANLLTIAIDGINLVNASDSSFIDGPVAKTGSSSPNAFVFPTGNINTYAPITISGSPATLNDYTATGAHTFIAEYFHTNPAPLYDITSKDASLNNIGTCEYWTLNLSTPGIASPYVWLSYDNVRSCGILDPSSLRVTKWDALATPSPAG